MGCCLAGLLLLGRRCGLWHCGRAALQLAAVLEVAALLSFGYLHRAHLAAFFGLTALQQICTA